MSPPQSSRIYRITPRLTRVHVTRWGLPACSGNFAAREKGAVPHISTSGKRAERLVSMETAGGRSSTLPPTVAARQGGDRAVTAKGARLACDKPHALGVARLEECETAVARLEHLHRHHLRLSCYQNSATDGFFCACLMWQRYSDHGKVEVREL